MLPLDKENRCMCCMDIIPEENRHYYPDLGEKVFSCLDCVEYARDCLSPKKKGGEG